MEMTFKLTLWWNWSLKWMKCARYRTIKFGGHVSSKGESYNQLSPWNSCNMAHYCQIFDFWFFFFHKKDRDLDFIVFFSDFLKQCMHRRKKMIDLAISRVDNHYDFFKQLFPFMKILLYCKTSQNVFCAVFKSLKECHVLSCLLM